MHRNNWLVGLILIVLFGSLYSIFFNNWQFVMPFSADKNQKVKLGLDLQGGINLVLAIDEKNLPKGITMSEALDRGVEVIRNRIDQLGIVEPLIQREGDNWIVVQMPGVKDPEEAKKLIGQTALLEFRMLNETDDVSKAIEGKVPEGSELLYAREGGTPYLVKKEQLLTGDDLANAKMMMGGGSLGNEPYVSMDFSPEGGRKFAKVTGANVNKRLAIILDGRVYSAPVIKSKISGGHAIIEGSFDMKEASKLAIVLKSGSLPAPLTIINEDFVGPTLGKDSIEKGKMAGMIGIISVMVLMGLYYKLSGVIAGIGMLFNLVYLLGAMTALGATFTMPGIAGIILTMGISVDSNVLIFERIREELLAGKTVRSSIDAGYKRALVTIIDSHVTTLITSLILFQFGTGPIRGFAVTLSLGVLISLFTAVVVTRIVFDWRMARGEVQNLSI
jgi:preprotein translocase subunit SecD